MLDEKIAVELARKTNVELIDSTLENMAATPAELELASRLQGAIEELENLTQALQRFEAKDGANT